VTEGDSFANARTGARLEITALPADPHGPDRLEVRRVLRPGTGFRFPHVHVELVERFRVESGVADARVGHRRLRLGPGDEFLIPPRTTHVNPCNRGLADLVFRQEFEPATDDALRYVRTLATLLEEGRDVRGDLPLATALAILDPREPQTYAPRVPRALQRHAVLPVARAVRQWREERRLLREEEAAAAAAGPGYWADA
jgi:mannose-6-phosphate isomerase-like protein (cupin superfamily)